jgi:hypothetical protein
MSEIRELQELACANCPGRLESCDDPDCWHRDFAEPFVHVGTGSHYCTSGSDNMVAEVRANA